MLPTYGVMLLPGDVVRVGVSNRQVHPLCWLNSVSCLTYNALSIEELLGNDGCQAAQQMTITVNDNDLQGEGSTEEYMH